MVGESARADGAHIESRAKPTMPNTVRTFDTFMVYPSNLVSGHKKTLRRNVRNLCASTAAEKGLTTKTLFGTVNHRMLEATATAKCIGAEFTWIAGLY